MTVRCVTLCLLSLAPVLGGCSSYAPPRLSVAEARVSERSESATVVRFTLAAENANEVELPLTEVEYAVRLDGVEVFRGVRSPEATLRRLGVQTFEIPAVIRHDGAAPAGPRELVIDGRLRYVTPGSIAQILFDTGVRRPSVSFQQQVSVDLATEPPASP